MSYDPNAEYPKNTVTVISEPTPPPAYAVKVVRGAIYREIAFGKARERAGLYIGARVDNDLRLVSLTDGNRWADHDSVDPVDFERVSKGTRITIQVGS